MKVMVSACLVGRNCKYNGGNNYCPAVVDFLKDKEVVEICPEMLGGLGAPRSSVEIVGEKAICKDGRDVSREFEHGIKLAVEIAESEQISLAILQSRSPTCGVNNIYDGSFTGKLINGQGLFTRALIKSGFEVKDAEDFC